MKKLFGKDKPEDLTDDDLKAIIDHPSFEILITRSVRRIISDDTTIKQITLDRLNYLLDEILCKEDNRLKITELVIRQIDELHNVKILLDRIPHSKVESD